MWRGAVIEKYHLFPSILSLRNIISQPPGSSPTQGPPTQVSCYIETRDWEKQKFLVLSEKSDNKIGIILHSSI